MWLNLRQSNSGEELMKIHLIIVLLLLTLICSGTSTTMSFTEGSFVSPCKTLRLSICDETGEKEEFDYLSTANNEQLFFIADPITKEEFSKRDSDIIKDVKIVQGDEKVSPAKVDFIKNEKDATVASIIQTPIIGGVLEVWINTRPSI
jgi:phage anti-repressor protein